MLSLIARPYRLVHLIYRQVKNLSYRVSNIPLTNDNTEFEDLFYDLNQSLYQESDFIRKTMEGITDEEVIYKRGEGPLFVFKIDGKMVPRKGAIVMAKYFIAKRLELILQSIKDYENKKIIDVGTTSGIFLRHLNKKGVGLNISERAVESMKKFGVEAVLGSADDLKFADKSFDYLFSFQTIEHLENPLKALKEFTRVTREKVLVTIPNVPRTSICSFESSEQSVHQWHVFVFSDADFNKIARRAGLKVSRRVIIIPIGKPRTFRQKLFYHRWQNHPWFQGYTFYELIPDSGN